MEKKTAIGEAAKCCGKVFALLTAEQEARIVAARSQLAQAVSVLDLDNDIDLRAMEALCAADDALQRIYSDAWRAEKLVCEALEWLRPMHSPPIINGGGDGDQADDWKRS